MTNKERYEAFYKERGLEEFINLIVRNYLQLPSEYKMYDPATALLREDGKRSWEEALPKYLNINGYIPKPLVVPDAKVAETAVGILKGMKSPHAAMLYEIGGKLDTEECLYYILGSALDLPVYENQLPVIADLIYSVMRVLEKHHGVEINIPDELQAEFPLNVFGRLFCTSRNSRYEMLYGLQSLVGSTAMPHLVSNAKFVQMATSCAVPMSLEVLRGIISEKTTDTMIKWLLEPKGYHRLPADIRLCLLYNIGVRLLHANSDISIANNVDSVLKSKTPTTELFYAKFEEK